MEKHYALALAFVDLVRKHEKEWPTIKSLPEEEEQILRKVLTEVGFRYEALTPGRLVGHYCEQDGSSTGETFPLNELCPFKVTFKRDGRVEDHERATQWLNGLMKTAVFSSAWIRRKEREEAALEVARDMEKSTPLPPIQITGEGDALEDYSPPGFDRHSRDENEFNSTTRHGYCGGYMDRRHSNPENDVIVCRQCYLRVSIPNKIKTYGELRSFMQSRFSK